MITKSAFKAAWWLNSSHAQTIYPSLFKRCKSCVDFEERIELPDGDFIDVSWAKQGLPETSPLVILLHGLGGSVQSTYIAGLMQACVKKGWRAVLMHFRGASQEANRHARAYHSGDTGDLDYFVKLLAKREPESTKFAVGVSLGGNVLLKWLGESSTLASPNIIKAAVAVSVPFELRLVADQMNRGFSRVYQRYLLQRLKKFFHRKTTHYKEELPVALQEFEKWQCFWTFDEKVTAPLHGFSSVHAYYRQSSCRQYLQYIQTPTLIIHSKDDPFMTPKVLPQEPELADAVTLELSATGGHVGFVGGNIPGKPLYWLDKRIPQYFEEFLR